jgi:hypothetical protein
MVYFSLWSSSRGFGPRGTKSTAKPYLERHISSSVNWKVSGIIHEFSPWWSINWVFTWKWNLQWCKMAPVRRNFQSSVGVEPGTSKVFMIRCYQLYQKGLYFLNSISRGLIQNQIAKFLPEKSKTYVQFTFLAELSFLTLTSIKDLPGAVSDTSLKPNWFMQI